MRRLLIALFCLAVSAMVYAQARRRAVLPAPPAATPQNAGAPLAGLTTAELSSFNAGRNAFRNRETVSTGLGPVFNDDSCDRCHNAPVFGGGSNRTVTRFARRTNGTFDSLMNLGGQLVQNRGIGGRDGSPHNFPPERVPLEANVVTLRISTPLFGLGLVDATPDADFIALAATEAARGDGTAGRVNLTDNIRAGMKTVGRFGWKAQVPTLVQFAGDALVNEIGITNPDFPNENCPQGNCAELQFNPAPALNDTGTRVASLTNFMKLLAPPARGPITPDVIDGERIFNDIGCGSCHVSTLATGSNPVAALDHKTYHPYSDFLVHDMGSLGDGIEMGSAAGSEVRTAPLWGLRFVNSYLHDGRASTLDHAIAAHEGQGAAARNRFVTLLEADKQKLIAFLRSL